MESRPVWNGERLEKGRSLAKKAIEADRADCIGALARAGLDPDMDSGAGPLLSYAARLGKIGACEALLEAGANPDCRASASMPILSYAACKGDARLAAMLLAKGADPDGKRGGEAMPTPLMLAIRRGHYPLAQMLVASGADLEARSAQGWRPLHWAALMRDERSAKMLLSAGADLEAKDAYGNTPMDVSAAAGAANADLCMSFSKKIGDWRRARDLYGQKAQRCCALIEKAEIESMFG